MNSNVVQFPVSLKDPQVQALQGISSAYMKAWQTQYYSFLPPLHELLERHARFFIKSVEAFHLHAGRISSTINAGSLSDIIENIEALDDPLDIAEYLEVGQDALVSIAAALSKQVAALKNMFTDLNALGVYSVSRDLTRYQDVLARLGTDQPARTRELHAKEGQLAGLDESIKVLEAANVEALFKGNIPTSQQIKEAAAMIASGGVTVEAVERALKQIGDLIGNVLEGMRYSGILEQRRALQKTVDDLNADLRAMEKLQCDTQSYCERLAEYSTLVTQRDEWRTLFNQIIEQLEPVLRQLAGYQVKTLVSLIEVHPLIEQLYAYARKVLADFTPGH